MIMLQMSNDGNTTTSILSFMATKTDAGRQLSCRAENPIMGSESIRDNWVLEIQCKRIKDTLAEKRPVVDQLRLFTTGTDRHIDVFNLQTRRKRGYSWAPR